MYVILWWMDWLVFHLTFMWQIGSPSNDRHSIILHACSKKYSSSLSAFEKLSEQCIVIDTYYGKIRKLCIGVLSRKHELGAKSKVTISSDASFVTRDNHRYTAILRVSRSSAGSNESLGHYCGVQYFQRTCSSAHLTKRSFISWNRHTVKRKVKFLQCRSAVAISDFISVLFFKGHRILLLVFPQSTKLCSAD